MDQTKNYVRWSLLGMQGMFFAWALAEVVLGLISVQANYSSGAGITQFEGSVFLRILLGLLVFATLLLGRFSYRKRMMKLQADWHIVKKMNWFRKAYVSKMMLFTTAGLLTLVGYLHFHFTLWLLPWIISLYLIGRNFPFKPMLRIELSMSEEESKLLEANCD